VNNFIHRLALTTIIFIIIDAAQAFTSWDVSLYMGAAVIY
jgi:hypothetical protein